MDETYQTNKPPTGEDFDQSFASFTKSSHLKRIWQQAYGIDYPEEVEPTSFLTLTLLRRFAQELHITPGQRLGDLGCGRGGPGLWVARETGACLLGIDFSGVAVAQATERAQSFGLTDRATFLQRDILHTGLPDSYLDAAMSVDVWQLLPDKPAAAREIVALLRPGSRFVCTTWASDQPIPGRPLMEGSYPQFFQEAGGIVEIYEETPDWEPRQRAIYEGILAAQQELVTDVSEKVTEAMVKEAQRMLALFTHLAHILMVIRRAEESG